MYIEKIYDVQTGEETIVERPFTKDELAAIEAEKKAAEKRQAELEAKASARAAILEKLGLTEDEAKLLLS